MCGIYGIVGPRIDPEKVKRATHTLAHRGPDEVGFFFGETVGLGHHRLSIIDLSTGRQPIFNEDGSKCIIHNGEIYNFMEVRELLQAKGHVFTTRSDSETILHAYEEWGEACVEHLRGMFAFAIWDERSKTLFLARDRLGVNPLFYAEYGGKFFFASEMKAILVEEGFPRDLDQTALASYFTLSYIPAPYTIFSHIRKLLPGHTLTYREGKVQIRKFWDLECRPDRSKSEARFIEEFMDLLQEAVKVRLISDVPLGAFLSGGIDSSTVVALMSRVSRDPVNTFCMGFGGNVGGYLDERGYARQVAERYGTNHREHEVAPDPEGLIGKIVTAFDEPFADDSAIPSYFVCKMARENVTVALSGLGGDEVFAGYERYLGLMLSRAYRKIPASIREQGIRKVIESFGERRDGHYTINHMKRFVRSSSLPSDECYFGYLSILNPAIREGLFTERARFEDHAEGCRHLVLSHFNSSQVAEKEDLLARAFYCDIKTYLPEDILAVTDRMSMLSALETRAPFIDHKFLEFCATIPSEMKMKWYTKKYLLKKAVKPLLPKDILTHRKQGFVGPMAQWLKNDLKDFTQQTLTEKNLSRHGLFHYPTVRRVLDEHYAGREIHDTLIWSLLIFQTWYETYIENSGGREGL